MIRRIVCNKPPKVPAIRIEATTGVFELSSHGDHVADLKEMARRYLGSEIADKLHIHKNRDGSLQVSYGDRPPKEWHEDYIDE